MAMGQVVVQFTYRTGISKDGVGWSEQHYLPRGLDRAGQRGAVLMLAKRRQAEMGERARLDLVQVNAGGERPERCGWAGPPVGLLEGWEDWTADVVAALTAEGGASNEQT